MNIRAITIAHLLYSFGEKTLAIKNISIFCKEAKDQPSHEVVHVCATVSRSPIWVLSQQLYIKLVQSPCRSNVYRVVLDLFDRRDARQWQQKTKVVGEIFKSTGNGFPINQIFSLKCLSICSQNELGFGFNGGRAFK